MAGRMRSVTKQVQGTPHEFQKRYGPWVLIAGASEGVGAALARAMASRSINCMLVARRSEPLERLAEKIRTDFRVEVTTHKIGRASCRERVCQYVYISVGAVSLYKKTETCTDSKKSVNRSTKHN